MRIVKNSPQIRMAENLLKEIKRLKKQLDLVKKEIEDSKHKASISIWLSENDTYRWANRPGNKWPCSQISGKRLFASFDKDGNLIDFSLNGKIAEIDSNEFDAITYDFIQGLFS